MKKVCKLILMILVNECSKLIQKEYKSRHDRVRKEIHWELCKRLKFDITDKCYMLKPISVFENEMYKILGDFEIQTYHPVEA